VFTAFPQVFAKGQCVGNPLRAEFLNQADPQTRFAGRSGPLQLLVVGGSLGARFLVDQGAGWLMPQTYMTPDALAEFIRTTDRPALLQRALAAKQMQQLRATDAVVAACEELAA